MSKTYRIIITSEALSELEEIADYIRQDSPQNAVTVAGRILDAMDSLVTMPTRYKRVGKSRKRGTPIHASVSKPFILYYRVDESPAQVFILRILHGARRQPRQFD